MQELYVQLNEVVVKTRKIYSEVLITLDCKQALKDVMKLSYFVPSAGWEPLYDFRMDEISKPLTIVYNSNVYQSSGEDWKDVNIKLSTNNPTLSGEKPELHKRYLGQRNIYQKGLPKKGSGAIKGRVYDAETNEPIPFANVVIELGGKIVNGGTTDFDGKYSIRPIPPGKYDVKVTYVGYKNLMIKGVLINANKIRFLDVQLESTTTTLKTFEVVDYKIPLIDKDQTSTGGTMTNEELTKMAGRSATAVAVTVGGVFSDENGNMGGIRGGRSGGTATYIDGVRVIGSANLPQSAIDQVSVITGGTPAMYGDFTGGIVNITTKGPSRSFGAGFEAVTSEGLDGYGYNLLGFSVNGPLIKGKDSTKNTSLLGFFISGEGTYIRDGSPASIGTYKVNDETLDWLRKNPVRPSGTGFGSYPNSEFIRSDDLQQLHTRLNAEGSRINLAGKIDVKTTDYTNLTFGGSVNYSAGKSWSRGNSLYNYNNNGIYNFHFVTHINHVQYHIFYLLYLQILVLADNFRFSNLHLPDAVWTGQSRSVN